MAASSVNVAGSTAPANGTAAGGEPSVVNNNNEKASSDVPAGDGTVASVEVVVSKDDNGPLSAKVFAVTELLECILLHLSLCDLLRSERVCKAWLVMIGSSVNIRRVLFRQPAALGLVTSHDA